MPTEPISIAWLLNKAWVLLIGVFWYSRKSQDQKDEARDAAIARLKETYVTELQMKEAIKESLVPYKEDQKEIKDLLREVHEQVSKLSTEMAVQNAIRNLTNEKPRTNGGQQQD